MEVIINENIGAGPIQFGMHKNVVHELLGNPEFSHGSREGFLSGFIINYNSNHEVEFIELAKSGKYQALYKHKNVHETPAIELISHICKFDSFDQTDPELGHSYIFKKLQLSLWRSVVPSSPADVEGQYFEAVGIGASGYFL